MNVRQLRNLMENVPDDTEIVVDVGDGWYKSLHPVWVANMVQHDHASFEEIPLGANLDEYKNVKSVWVLE